MFLKNLSRLARIAFTIQTTAERLNSIRWIHLGFVALKGVLALMACGELPFLICFVQEPETFENELGVAAADLFTERLG